MGLVCVLLRLEDVLLCCPDKIAEDYLYCSFIGYTFYKYFSD